MKKKRKKEREGVNYVFVCQSIKYSVHANFIYGKISNSIMWDSAWKFFGSSWHLIFQEYWIYIILASSSRTLFVASPLSWNQISFRLTSRYIHALLCGLRRNRILSHAGNWLRKVNIEEGCLDITLVRRYSPQECRRKTGQTVLSSIKKSLFHHVQHVREWWFTKYNKLCFTLSTPSTNRKKSVTSQ